MNAQRLLDRYERIADAPDAIGRLRRFILDLAVRGKLVPQDPNDEPASELLKRIAAEKARLVKAGEIRKQEPIEQLLSAEMMFSVPESWRWVPATYPAYVVSDMDKKVQTKDVLESGKFPVVDQGKVFIRGYCNDPSKVIRVKAPLILFGDHTRETKLINFDFVVGADGVKLLQPVCLFTNFYFLALQWLPLDSRGYGRHFKLLRTSYIPLPPLAEQHRIVAKVDELMALCDRLDTARAEREATRDRLTAASLARLNAPDPDTFRDDAHFALDALPALTARPDQIKQLRQTILNLAVRGKLVPQDPNDEPASDLLKCIAKERQKRMKGNRGAVSISDKLDLFEPIGWASATMSELAIFENGDRSSNYPSGSDILGFGIPFFSTKNLSDHKLRFSNLDFISEAKFASLRSGRLQDRDILITLRGSIGKLGLFRANDEYKTGFINAQLLIVRSFVPEFVDFFLTFMKSEAFSAQLDTRSSGSATPQLSAGQLAEVVIPVPPLAEQHRIVAKVDALMALCDRLEAILAAAAATRRRLLESVLHHAIAPTIKDAA
jgi:type I restriction enzyme S subunit